MRKASTEQGSLASIGRPLATMKVGCITVDAKSATFFWQVTGEGIISKRRDRQFHQPDNKRSYHEKHESNEGRCYGSWVADDGPLRLGTGLAAMARGQSRRKSRGIHCAKNLAEGTDAEMEGHRRASRRDAGAGRGQTLRLRTAGRRGSHALSGRHHRHGGLERQVFGARRHRAGLATRGATEFAD